jgi:hypothetical protein
MGMSVYTTQISFPVSAIKELRGIRTHAWDGFIDQIIQLDPGNSEVIGLVLLMTRLCGCTTCNSDSFRMLKGCEECGKQAMRRIKSQDDELFSTHDNCVKEIEIRLKENDNE